MGLIGIVQRHWQCVVSDDAESAVTVRDESPGGGGFTSSNLLLLMKQ